MEQIFLRCATAVIIVCASAFNILADIAPRPDDQPPPSVGWTYVAAGVACAIAGALVFVWLGRRVAGKK